NPAAGSLALFLAAATGSRSQRRAAQRGVAVGRGAVYPAYASDPCCYNPRYVRGAARRGYSPAACVRARHLARGSTGIGVAAGGSGCGGGAGGPGDGPTATLSVRGAHLATGGR